MKNIAITLLLFIPFLSFAQENEKRAEKIKNLRIAFISTKLDLTTEEAQKFWPVFNKFDDKQTILFKQNRQLMFKLKSENTSNISEKEMQGLLDQSETIETGMQNNRKQFVKELQGVIPAQKILLLRKIEDDFKQRLISQFRKGNNKQE
ncbi:sensor of ECF-type sigma factor [Flavobacterium sp.]|uniref:sensor of ECF-type sigma factor n=1 Tax=Flavobacterium sp. TaxID=239 RepID=UPI00286E65F1|nr:sensor of ECF-type sigma factor [Flavobacterium sp.]